MVFIKIHILVKYSVVEHLQKIINKLLRIYKLGYYLAKFSIYAMLSTTIMTLIPYISIIFTYYFKKYNI
jgi:hypothetical protein